MNCHCIRNAEYLLVALDGAMHRGTTFGKSVVCATLKFADRIMGGIILVA